MSEEPLQWEVIRDFRSGYMTRDPAENLPSNAMAGGSQNFQVRNNEARVRPGYVQRGDNQGGGSLACTGIYYIPRNLDIETAIITWSDGDVDVMNLSSFAFTEIGNAVMANALVSFTTYDDFDIYADGTNVRRAAGATHAALADAALAGTPPAYPYLATWRNSVWLFDDATPILRYSAAENPESWPAANVINVDLGGPPGTGLVEFGDRLVCFKKNGIDHIVGYDALSWERIPVNREIGCISNSSISWVNVASNPRWNGLYWADAQGIYFSSDGGFSVERISSTVPQLGIASPPNAGGRLPLASTTVSGISKGANEVWFTMGPNQVTLAWNYEIGAWSYYSVHPFSALGSVFDGTEWRLYAGGNSAAPGDIYDLSPAAAVVTDDAAGITAKLRTKMFTFGTPERKATLRKIVVNHANNDGDGATWTYNLYTDFNVDTVDTTGTFTQSGFSDEIWFNKTVKALQVELQAPTGMTEPPDVSSLWIGYVMETED